MRCVPAYLGAQVAGMKPALLADILRDTSAVAVRCVGLRDALPHANVSRLVAGQPAVLLQVLGPAMATYHVAYGPMTCRLCTITGRM